MVCPISKVACKGDNLTLIVKTYQGNLTEKEKCNRKLSLRLTLVWIQACKAKL